MELLTSFVVIRIVLFFEKNAFFCSSNAFPLELKQVRITFPTIIKKENGINSHCLLTLGIVLLLLERTVNWKMERLMMRGLELRRRTKKPQR